MAFVAIDHSDFVNGVASPTFPLYLANISPKIHVVTDFCVVGDYAFFCGYRSTYDTSTLSYSNIYYIGHFDMNELITGPNVHYKMMKIPDASVLERIEGFDDVYGFKVYALGSKWVGDTANRHAIYEIDNPPAATGYSYVLLDTQLPLYAERMDEIVVLEKEVVFLGRDNFHLGTTYPGAINMLKINKTMGLSDLQLAILYLFQNPIQDEYNSAIHATYMGNNEFVISYTHTDYTDGNSYNRIRVFDNQLTNTNSQQYPREDKLSLYDLAYNRDNEVLTISEPWQGTSRFVFAKPNLTFNYMTLFLYDLDVAYGTLDTISGQQYITASGKNYLMQHAGVLSYNPQATSNDCLYDETFKVDIISDMTSSTMPLSPTYFSPNSTTESPLKPMTTYLMDIICNSK